MRALNLIAILAKHGHSSEYRKYPLFHAPVLNRSIIVKHRLRANERDVFNDERRGATKVILPIDIADLRSGARSFFVGQRGYLDVLREVLGGSDESNTHDRALLEMIDSLPSLDPFLMRERFKQMGFHAARCYFELSDADTTRMFLFVEQEVAPLIGMTYGSVDTRRHSLTAKLAEKIMANASDSEMEPLRIGMGMESSDFAEGIFCWKGFIYYKWSMADLLPKVRPLLSQFAAIKPSGPITDEERAYIIAARARLAEAIAGACETVRVTLKIYDDAYRDLTRNGQPKAFREFLLTAPRLFHELGERLGAIQHIVSFWGFRFPVGGRKTIDTDELIDLLADFELSLGATTDRADSGGSWAA